MNRHLRDYSKRIKGDEIYLNVKFQAETNEVVPSEEVHVFKNGAMQGCRCLRHAFKISACLDGIDFRSHYWAPSII